MNITLDGFMAGPGGELDWHFKTWSPAMEQSLCEQLKLADTILLGRNTYRAMAKYWPSETIGAATGSTRVLTQMMNSYSKIVFSKNTAMPGLTTDGWNNVVLVNGDTRNEIIKLKQQPGKDLIIYGSGMLVSSLMQMNLIDEYILWLHPVVLGDGKPFFNNMKQRLALKLVKSEVFSSGVVVVYYESLK